MTKREEKFFNPCVRLTGRSGIFMLNDAHQFDTMAQLKKEAKFDGSITDRNYDDFLATASARGHSVETEE